MPLGNPLKTCCVGDEARRNVMAKKSILREAEETVVEATKAGVAVAKLAATAGLAAAGPAAAGVVLESVSKGLKSAEETVENAKTRETFAGVGLKPTSPRKQRTGRKPRAQQKKRAVAKTAAAKKRSAPKKKKKASKNTAAKKTLKRKRAMRRRKR
jgi:hypothetical protein